MPRFTPINRKALDVIARGFGNGDSAKANQFCKRGACDVQLHVSVAGSEQGNKVPFLRSGQFNVPCEEFVASKWHCISPTRLGADDTAVSLCPALLAGAELNLHFNVLPTDERGVGA